MPTGVAVDMAVVFNASPSYSPNTTPPHSPPPGNPRESWSPIAAVSVATDIARVLKAPRDKSKDFFENDDYVISSAVGHLLTIIVPPDQDIKRGK